MIKNYNKSNIKWEGNLYLETFNQVGIYKQKIISFSCWNLYTFAQSHISHFLYYHLGLTA